MAEGVGDDAPLDQAGGGRASTSSSSSVRTVVAPSRRLQKAAKSCSPSRCCGAGVHRVDVERPAPTRARGAGSAGRPGRGGRRCDRRSAARAPRSGRRTRARPPTARRMRTSPSRMPLSRRTSACRRQGPSSVPPRRRRRPGRRRSARPARARARRCRSDRRRPRAPIGSRSAMASASSSVALDGPQTRLGRPAVEVGAVVGEVEPDAHPQILGGPSARPPLRDTRRVSNPAIILVSGDHLDVLEEQFWRYTREYDVRCRPHRVRGQAPGDRRARERRAGRAVRAGVAAARHGGLPGHRQDPAGGPDGPPGGGGALGELPRATPTTCGTARRPASTTPSC